MTFSPAPRQASVAERLAAFSFVRGLSPEGLEVLAADVTPLEAPVATRLLTEGNSCDALLLVERGAIRVFKQAPSGREITLYQVSPGESCVLGTSCLLQDAGYPAEAVVDRAIDGLAVSAALFRRLFNAEMAVRQFVMEMFGLRLAGMMVLVEEIAFRKVDQRLARFLVEQAEAVPGVYRPIVMTHNEIAVRIGTAREVVSRLLQQFAEEGLLEIERRQVRLCQPEQLRERLEDGGR